MFIDCLNMNTFSIKRFINLIVALFTDLENKKESFEFLNMSDVRYLDSTSAWYTTIVFLFC